MNQLIAKTPSEISSKELSVAVSPRLWVLLSDERADADDAIHAILTTPGLLAETREALPALEAKLAPCGDVFVVTELTKWSLVFDPGVRGEVPAFWTPYKRALADLPQSSILGAMADWEKQPDAEFLPKPGPLRALALKRAGPLYCAIGRARRAIKSPMPRAPINPGTAEDRKAFVESLGLGQAKRMSA